MIDTKLYDILGVQTNSSKDEIKKAYKKLALKYHPDRVKDASKRDEAEKKFKEISSAYDILSDDTKRRNYDQFGLDNMKSMDSAFGGMGENPFDMFSNMFGGMGMGMNMNNSRRVKRGKDFIKKIEVSIEDFYLCSKVSILLDLNDICAQCNGSGGKNKDSVTKCNSCEGRGMITQIRQMGPMISQSQTTCYKCKGTGRTIIDTCNTCNGERVKLTKKKINIQIKPTTKINEKIVLEGHGHKHPDNDIQGDLILILIEKQNKYYSRHNEDLFLRKSISLIEALCGAELEFTTIDKRRFIVKTSDIIHPNSVYKIRNEGMPLENDSRGDLYIEFNVIFPSYISNERKSYLKRLLTNKEVENKEKTENKNEVKSIKLMQKVDASIKDTFKLKDYNYDYKAKTEDIPEMNDDIPCHPQ